MLTANNVLGCAGAIAHKPITMTGRDWIARCRMAIRLRFAIVECQSYNNGAVMRITV